MAGDGRVNPIYRQMLVLAVRSGAAGAARYFVPENLNSPTDDRAQAKVEFPGQDTRLSGSTAVPTQTPIW